MVVYYGVYCVVSECWLAFVLSLQLLPIPGDRWHRYVPEPIGRVVNGTGETALRRQVGGQRCQRFCIITRIIGELDCYGFGRALRYSVMQVFDRTFGLNALVVPHKTHAFGQTCRRTDFSIEGTI